MQMKKRGQAGSKRKSPRIPVRDVWGKQKPFVMLLATEVNYKSKAIAWYPEEGKAYFIRNPHLMMPPMYRPVDSCAGYVCAIHMDSVTNDESCEYTLQLAVSNPTTKYQVELPVLELWDLKSVQNHVADFNDGSLRMGLAPPEPGERFRVYVASTSRDACSVYTFSSSSWRWESSVCRTGDPVSSKVTGELLFAHGDLRAFDFASRSWSGINFAAGDKLWCNTLPEPPAGERYRFLFLFRYGRKVMAVCMTSLGTFVLVKRVKNEWKLVESAQNSDFVSCSPRFKYLLGSPYEIDHPVFSGDLIAHSFFFKPIVFNLRTHSWMELPPAVAKSKLGLQPVCVYRPAPSPSPQPDTPTEAADAGAGID